MDIIPVAPSYLKHWPKLLATSLTLSLPHWGNSYKNEEKDVPGPSSKGALSVLCTPILGEHIR